MKKGTGREVLRRWEEGGGEPGWSALGGFLAIVFLTTDRFNFLILLKCFRQIVSKSKVWNLRTTSLMEKHLGPICRTKK